MEKNIHELLNPVVPGEPHHEKWVIGAVEAPGGDEAKVVFLLADGGTGREIRLEMTARDGAKECCEHSRSFNFALSSKGRESLSPGEEMAVAMVIHAISANDRGRLILRKDGEGNTELARVGREHGLWDRLASRFGNRGRPRRGENQPV